MVLIIEAKGSSRLAVKKEKIAGTQLSVEHTTTLEELPALLGKALYEVELLGFGFNTHTVYTMCVNSDNFKNLAAARKNSKVLLYSGTELCDLKVYVVNR